ncbi:thioredoxin domain-containing protein 8 isoform X2 [Prionailurus iriomotensis]
MDEFSRFLKAAGCKLVVVEFSAKWCGPCKRIYPLVHAMSLQYQNVMFANVDVDDSKELKIFEFCGADAQKLEAKIQELMARRIILTIKQDTSEFKRIPWRPVFSIPFQQARTFKKRNMGPDGNENEKSEKSSRGKSLSNILDSCKATALPGNPYSFSQRRWSFPPENPIRLKRFSGSVPPGD